MKKLNTFYFLCLIGIAVTFTNCVEQIDIKSINFEDMLIVEGTITNEYKFHKIRLSRTFGLDQNVPISETGAEVQIVDDSQNKYQFHEETPGNYISNIEFKANENITYQLKIKTSKGSSYSSEPNKLTAETQINTIIAIKKVDANGIEGISILVNSFNINGNAKYYRYEFEETYKIIPPYWSEYDAIVISDVKPYEVDFIPRTKEEKICYNTVYSEEIIQTETNSLLEDRVSNFPIRFIPGDDFIISNRYSILVKQYVQSPEAFTFYNTMKSLSGSESLFSQNQPGYFSGNIISDDDKDEKVIGFFEISSVSEKRIFVNPRELITNTPQYISNCELTAPDLTSNAGTSPLIEAIKGGSLKFFQINGGENSPIIPIPGGPYQMAPAVCSDCTILGSNIKPAFWVD
jgi:hypothetical protein